MHSWFYKIPDVLAVVVPTAMLFWFAEKSFAVKQSFSGSARDPEESGGRSQPSAGRPPVIIVELGPSEILAIEEDAIEQARRLR